MLFRSTSAAMRRRGWQWLLSATRDALTSLQQSTGSESLDQRLGNRLDSDHAVRERNVSFAVAALHVYRFGVYEGQTQDEYDFIALYCICEQVKASHIRSRNYSIIEKFIMGTNQRVVKKRVKVYSYCDLSYVCSGFLRRRIFVAARFRIGSR